MGANRVYFIARHSADVELIRMQLYAMHKCNDDEIIVLSKDEAEGINFGDDIVIDDVSPNQEHAIYLDHASNFERFGYAEDIVPEALHDGESSHNEKSLTKDKKEPNTRECPQCYQQMMGRQCKSCGWERPIAETIEDDGSMLKELGGEDGNKANRTTPKEIKEQFLSELQCYARQKGYKNGWAANQYKSKFSVWPNKINAHHTETISDMTKGWLKHQRIKYARRKNAAAS